MTARPTIAVVSRSEAGHRADYLRFVGSLFRTRRVGLFGALISSTPVLFLMVEESFLAYVAIGLLRAALGRRTAGLLFRPKPALEGPGARLKLKRAVLRLLKRVPSVQTLTIVPFSIYPAEEIADGWIYDFQLWDLGRDERSFLSDVAAGSKMASEIRAAARGRGVVAALGQQTRGKGYDVFAGAYSSNAALRERLLFVCAGKVDASFGDMTEAFARSGGVSMNRFAANDELLSAYATSDAIWCYYAEGYDQASGILGRAIQCGRPAIVREGSLSHRLCAAEGWPHLAVRRENLTDALIAGLPASNAALGLEKSAHYRAVSMAALEKALVGGRG